LLPRIRGFSVERGEQFHQRNTSADYDYDNDSYENPPKPRFAKGGDWGDFYASLCLRRAWGLVGSFVSKMTLFTLDRGMEQIYPGQHLLLPAVEEDRIPGFGPGAGGLQEIAICDRAQCDRALRPPRFLQLTEGACSAYV